MPPTPPPFFKNLGPILVAVIAALLAIVLALAAWGILVGA